jgi:RNA polymerase sigma factor (sigma-70 family)
MPEVTGSGKRGQTVADTTSSIEKAEEPAQQVFKHWALVNALARKQFRSEHLVLEAVNFVLNRLERDDWARVRQYAGRGTIKAYLSRVIQRLLHDFAREKFGRRQQPLWLNRRPAFWNKVYRLLCLERLAIRDVVEIVGADVPGGREQAAVREAAAVIRRRDPNCGRSSGERDTVSLDDVAEPAADADDNAASVRRAELMDLVFESLTAEQRETEADGVLAAQLETLKDRLALEAEERLLLRMIFEDGMKVTEAGRMLGLSVHVVHGQVRRLLERIRTEIDRAGLTDVLRTALEGADGD